MDAILDYYNRSPQVSLDTPVPQLDPKLLQAIQSTTAQSTAPAQQNDVAAKEQAIVQQAQRDQAAVQQQQAAGLGVQIRPEGDQALFPYDAYERKRNEILSKRQEAMIRANQHLARPDVAIQPEHVIKQARTAYESLIDQKYPKMEEFEKVRPEIEDLRKEIKENIGRRYKHVSDLRGIVDFIDYGKKPNETEKEFIKRATPILRSQLKIYNTALAGTSDALSNEERRKIAPQLNEGLFDTFAYFRGGGAGPFLSNIKGFKEQVQVLYDIILNEMNDGYNIIATQTSPEYANRSVGFSQFTPYQTIPFIPRVSYDSPREVIEGKKSMAQAFFERKAALDEATSKYHDMIDKMVSEQKANPDVAREVVSKAFQKEFGIVLPPKQDSKKPAKK